MRRSAIAMSMVALVALCLGLPGAACSKKDAKDAKTADVDVVAADAGPGDAGGTHDKAREKMAEKAKARQAARKAAKAAKEAREAHGVAAPGEDGSPAADGSATAEGASPVTAGGTPSPVTPAEAAAARAEAAAARAEVEAGGAPVPPPNATGAALVTREEAATPPPQPRPETPPPPAEAVAPGTAGGVEIVVRDDAALDLSKLVTLADVQKVMKKGALKLSEPLAGSLPARDYNGERFFASQNETLGVAVQVWRFPTTIDARRRYDLYSSRYPGAEKTDAVATQGFFAQSGDVLYLGFLDQTKKTVVIVSCSEDTCDMKDLYVLARDLQKKL